MKTTKWFLVAIVVVAGLVLATLFKSKPRPAQSTTPPEPLAVEEAALRPGVKPAPEPAPATPVPEPVPETQPAEAFSDVPPLPMVAMDAETILATVNGVAIHREDLMAVSPEKAAGTSLRADALENLLNIAIERELTFQAAQTRGLGLDEAQRQEIEQIRAEALARADAPFTLPGYDAGVQAAFEVRDRTAQLLQNAMLGVTGTPSQAVTAEQVQVYYEEHQAEFGKLPQAAAAREQAWLAIETEIRSRLQSAIYIQHERQRRELLDALAQEAVIERRVAPSAAD